MTPATAPTPAITPAVTASPTSLPSQFTTSDGKIPFWGIALYLVTFIALIYSIKQARASVKHMEEESMTDKKNIEELKQNVRSLMGGKNQGWG